ncbi:MAG TPA: M28 family peptidase [Gaiellaceae bacterium]|nr:M28 family peptidase [Gaiellaceae bacterium]
MAATRPPARRRRARRGSLERPLNARLYRGACLVLLLPLLVLAFSFVRPAPLPQPPLPPNFDGVDAASLAHDLAQHFPDRSPGGTGSVRAAQWFRDQMRQYNLPVSTDTWRQEVPGLGRQTLQNIWAVAPGESREAIVVLAHRDDTGAGPGVNDNATGTAALVELARGFARASAGSDSSVRSAHTIVFLSTDGGAYGGLGAARFAAHPPFPVVATIALTAIGGEGEPRLEIAGDTPRSPAATLVETAARRLTEQTGTTVRRAGLLAQLVDLGFPFTLYEQGPFVARGVPAVTITTAGARPPAAFTDRTLSTPTLTAVGKATQQLVGSLDQGLDLAQGTTTFLWTGGRILRGWAIELILFALLIPYAVTVVDLFAHCRRRRIPVLPAVQSLRSRIAFWLFVGAAFYVLGFLGAWPAAVARPIDPATRTAGDWPVLALLGLGVIALLGWVVARPRLVPRRPVTAEERLAGETAALLGLGVVALLVLATNPYALVFFVPALHAWLWLPQVRMQRGPWSAVVFLAGLTGPALLVLSLALRFGLGFDAPWYLVELAAAGFIRLPAVAIVLAATACAAQLLAVTANRYAPYPPRAERPARGPVRELVRRVVLALRARRRVTEERRRAFGG